MPVVRSWKGTHAKGSCEPGQAGRCSHKQRTLVQWISLFEPPAAGAFFLQTPARSASAGPHPGTGIMAKRKSSKRDSAADSDKTLDAKAKLGADDRPDSYTVLA